MPPLNSLETEHPILDSDFRSFCASHGIFSVKDFLLHDLYTLVEYAEQQPSERLKQGITEIFSIMDALHRPWKNGVELLEGVRKNQHALSTGCEGIDSLLKGGLHEGHVIELVGPSSSGKTQLCHLVAATVALQQMSNVVYIDTGNSFSPKRIARFVGKVEQKILQKTMNSIFCHTLYDIFAMLYELHQLEFKLKSQVDRGDGHVRLLIIDSISSLITPILGSSGPQGRALMTSTGSLLKKLAYEYNIAVLVTNHTVGGVGGTAKPALGETWKIIPHVRLLLSRDYGSNMCNMSILKHPSMASGKATRFTIHD